MLLGYRSKDESVHLRFGQEYHTAGEEYEKFKASYNDDHEGLLIAVIQRLLIRCKNWKSTHKYKNLDNLVRTVIWYLDHYHNDPPKSLTLANGKPALELSFRLPLTETLIYCGHLDRVAYYQG